MSSPNLQRCQHVSCAGSLALEMIVWQQDVNQDSTAVFRKPMTLPVMSWVHLWTQVLLAHLGLAWLPLCRRCKQLTGMQT